MASSPPPPSDPENGQSQPATRAPDPWWKIRLFHGIANDLRRRAPYYLSDWLDAWDYRVVPATVYMYFAKYVDAVHSFHSYTDESCRSASSPPWPSRWTCSLAPIQTTV